jgi:hypothetical protein
MGFIHFYVSYSHQLQNLTQFYIYITVLDTVLLNIQRVYKLINLLCVGSFCIPSHLFTFFPPMPPHSLIDFVVSPPGCGRSVTDFWGWDAHKALLRCPDEVDCDIWIWSTRRGLYLSSTELPVPWPPWESFLSRKNLNGRTGNQTRDLMISSQKLWPLDHKAALSLFTSIWVKIRKDPQ